jgi:hypothetical protein
MGIRMRSALATATALMLAAGPASAGSYPFTLHNFTSSDVSGVSVKNGKVIGFKRVLARSSATFTVEYPDGQCVSPRVRIKFAKGGFSDQGNYNVCTDGGVTVAGP